jgi:hypothetical protein
LDIKSKAAATAGAATTDANGGGLGLPRVELTSLTTLAPFADGDANYKKERTGLTVYNLTNNTAFKPGVYVWDGTKWTVTGGGNVKWFYMPSVNIPITSTGAGKTFNLYNAYKTQFTKQGNSNWRSSNSGLAFVPSPETTALYEASELDYVITYYDPTVITLGTTPISATGVLTYDVISLATTSNTYFNIIFVVK